MYHDIDSELNWLGRLMQLSLLKCLTSLQLTLGKHSIEATLLLYANYTSQQLRSCLLQKT